MNATTEFAVKYPPRLARVSGAKVERYYYGTEAKALAASEAAKHNARILARQGFDFGFAEVGRVRPPCPGTEAYFPEFWEVVVV